MKQHILALTFTALLVSGCSKSDEDLCGSLANECAEGDAAEAQRSLCLQSLDSKSCGDAARDFYECVDGAERTCSNGQLQTKDGKCLTELAAYLECFGQGTPQ